MDFDSIDEKQAFKLGFAAYCSDQGMTTAEATQFAEKSAWGWGAAAAAIPGAISATGQALGHGVEAAKKLSLIGLGLPAAAGLALGGGLGYGAAKFNEPDITPEDIKAQEIAETYKRYTDRIKARRAYQQYREAR